MDKRPNHLCIECDEVITEPICPGCLAGSMRTFVEEYDKELSEEIQDLAISQGEANCIFCEGSMNLCSHCFSREIYTFLDEKNPKIAEEFLSRFDFELRRALI
jgi:hypothetical protein